MRTSSFIFAFLGLALVAVQGAPVVEQELAGSSLMDARSVAEVAEADDAATPLEERAMTSSRITYYSGSQLNNPACGGPNPGRNSMIAAVKQGGRFKCGDRITIKHKHKSIKVKVVDYCPGCPPTGLDLSPGAFSKLASLDQGIIRNAKLSVA